MWSRTQFTIMDLTLGKYYRLGTGGKLLQLIKVTPKGFNFFDKEKCRCALRGHLYPKGFAGERLPRDQKTFTFNIYWAYLPIIPAEVENG